MGESPDLLVGRILDAPPRRIPASPLLADALADLAAADSGGQVAAAAVAHARALAEGRSAALAVLSPTRTELVIVGSTGYDCGSMNVGARIPLDAGLPLTEAARTGTAVVRMPPGGGGWVAVPLAADPTQPQGVLLVSLTAASPEPDVPLLSSLAGHARQALHRSRHVNLDTIEGLGGGSLPGLGDLLPVASASPAALAELVGPGRLDEATTATLSGIEVAAASRPLLPDAGGDLVEVVTAGDGFWVVVADACGSDRAAHDAAAALRTLVRVLAPAATDPDRLLAELDAMLGATDHDLYLTALAAHVQPTATGARLRLASAGHPLPVVVAGDEGFVLDEACGVGLPLNLRLGAPIGAPVHDLELARGTVVVAYTDGVTDRRDTCLPAEIVTDVCSRATVFDAVTALETVLDVLTAAHGPSRDDVAAALLRIC